MAKNGDEVAALLHLIIERMASGQAAAAGAANWRGKKERTAWEKQFAAAVVDPEVARLEAKLGEMNGLLAEDQSAANDALAVVLSGSEDGDNEEGLLLIDADAYWRPRQRVTVANLCYKLGERRLAEKCPVFARFHREQETLCQVQHLPDIVQLQDYLVRKFAGDLESAIADGMTVEDFVLHRVPTEDRARVAKLINCFIGVFNALKRTVFEHGKRGGVAKSFLKEADLSYTVSKASTLFPSTHDAGQCATQVVSVLAEAHNGALAYYANRAEIPLPMHTGGISPSALTKAHLVVYEETELQLQIIASSEYDLHTGANAGMEWRLKDELFERNVRER